MEKSAIDYSTKERGPWWCNRHDVGSLLRWPQVRSILTDGGVISIVDGRSSLLGAGPRTPGGGGVLVINHLGLGPPARRGEGPDTAQPMGSDPVSPGPIQPVCGPATTSFITLQYAFLKELYYFKSWNRKTPT